MKRFVKYIIAFMLVGGFSLGMSFKTDVRPAFAQGPVIDVPNLTINITHLLEEMIRLGENINGVTSAVANDATVKTITSIVKGIQEIAEVMSLIGMGVDSASLVYQLIVQISDDIVFFKEYNESLKEMQAAMGDDFMRKTLSSMNLVRSYISMVNVIIRSTTNQINYVTSKVKIHQITESDGSVRASDWTAREVLETIQSLTYSFYSEYYTLRSLYMYRYNSMYSRMSRHCIALGNEKALKILF